MTREATITETEIMTLGWWASMEAMPVQDESSSMFDAATDGEKPQSSSVAIADACRVDLPPE